MLFIFNILLIFNILTMDLKWSAISVVYFWSSYREGEWEYSNYVFDYAWNVWYN